MKLNPVKAEKVIKILSNSGFSIVRQKGSHVIPDHQDEELGRGILRAIIRQAGMTRDEFINKLE